MRTLYIYWSSTKVYATHASMKINSLTVSYPDELPENPLDDPEFKES